MTGPRAWRPRRQAAALLAVLIALGIASALVIGGAYVTRQLASAAATSQRGDALEGYAEEAVIRALEGWSPSDRSTQSVGSTAEVGSTTSGQLAVTATVTRVGTRTYWVVGIAESRAKPLLRRRLGVVVLADSAGWSPAPDRAWSELP